MIKTDNIPKWNLSTIYSSLESHEYLTDLNELKSIIETLNKTLSLPISDFETFLADYLKTLNRLCFLSKTIFAYAYIIYSTDTTNTKFMNNLNLVDELSTEINQLDVKFTSILSENKDLCIIL